MALALKRVEKLLKNTEGFEIISQPDFWEPIYFSSKLDDLLRVEALWFSVRISNQKIFTENFVEKYVALARGHLCWIKQTLALDPLKSFTAPNSKQDAELMVQATIQSISQIILESEQGEFLLKLVSDLPEKSVIIPKESDVELLKSNPVFGKARALMKCANCKVIEKSEKEFQKCSRCGFVFYCSKACQRNDWQNHKQICKEIRK